EENAERQRITYVYDELYRVLTETVPGGDVVHYTYDEKSHRNGFGNLTTVAGTRGSELRYRYENAYDAWGNLAQSTRTMAGRTFNFINEHDAAARITGFIYPDGTRRRNEYTVNGILSIVDLCEDSDCASPEKWRNVLRYSSFTATGLAGGLAFANGVRSAFEYTPWGDVKTSVSTVAAGTKLIDNSYEWNKLSNVHKVNDRLDAAGSEQFEYTAQGYLRRAIGPYGTIDLTYDSAGNRKTRRDADRPETVYDYNARGQLIAARSGGATTYSASYDAAGNLAQQTAGSTQTFEFDAPGQLRSVCDGPCSDGKILGDFDYDYLGRRIRKTDKERTTTWYVDDSYELVIPPDEKAQHTRYIAGSNANAASETTAETDLDAQFAATGAALHAGLYEPRTISGTLLRTRELLRAWLLRDPGSALSDALSLLALLLLFLFAALLAAGPRTRWASAHRHHLAVWPLLMIALLLTPGFAFSAPYAHETPSPLRMLGGGIPKQDQQLFFTPNHIESVSLVTDRAGEVVARVSYKPFGELHEALRTERDVFRDKFISRELDLDTGLYAFGTRYYDPVRGRFISADPNVLGGPDLSASALNRYTYSLQNPVTFIDPGGEAALAVVVAAIIIGAIIGAYVGASIVNDSFNPLEWDWGSSQTYVGLTAGAAIGAIGGAISVSLPAAFGGGVVANIIAGAAAGAFENAAFSLLAQDPPEEILKSAVNGALMGAAFGAFAGLGGRTGSRLASGAESATGEASLVRRSASECLCFAGGTEVATAEGPVNVEDVGTGDEVWSSDDGTGKPRLNRVGESFERTADEVVRIDVAGVLIDVTPEHKVFVEGRGWVKAAELNAGDRLRSLDGSTAAVESINYVAGEFQVYNFEVDQAHTYFVTAKQFLVHNPPKCDPRFQRATFRKATLQNEWKSAPKVSQNTRKCPTCPATVTKKINKKGEVVIKSKGVPKGYDSDHIGATWAERRNYMVQREKATGFRYNRKEILDEYNRSTRLQCSVCNQSHKFEPTSQQTKNYFKTIPKPTH
ncbi:MAG TPA: polymorphic toxin-type HINT domain-containing protein, partial [Thermoanaerobaculia bacterium]|nr:polymorphic toxin-type HINT domain-containing protein [Thermoanaerobaculia bacterium]